MGFFTFDPKELSDEELNKKVQIFRTIVFGGMILALGLYLVFRGQGMLTPQVRQYFFIFLFILFPFTIPLNRLHKEYFARKRER